MALATGLTVNEGRSISLRAHLAGVEPAGIGFGGRAATTGSGIGITLMDDGVTSRYSW